MPQKEDDFYLLQPLQIKDGEDLEVLTSINKGEDNNLYAEVHSKSDNDWLTYTKFRVGLLENESPNQINIEAIKRRTLNSKEVSVNGEKQKNEEIIGVSDKWDCLNNFFIFLFFTIN